MDERYRDSLQRHHSFLMTHILLTDDVIQLLASEKILPETMIKDIQDGDTKEERNKRLLNAVRLRGNKSYKRFRELMYRTGNFFVADLLWDETEERAELMIDEGELDVKFSTVMNCLHDSQRKKFLHYLDAKVREKALVLAWREKPEDRMESLSAKVVDFNQEWGLRDTIATQERKIKDLEGQLQTGNDKQRAMRLEISSMEQQMKALKKEHLTHLATQSRFHDANIQTITRLKNRLARSTDKVILLDGLITSTLDGGGSSGKKKKKKKKSAAGMEEEEEGEEEEEEEGEEAKLASLETNVQRLLQEFHHEKDQARAGRKQREDVLNLLNRTFSKDSLVSVVKEVLKHEQKHRALVMRDIQRLSDTLKQVVPSSTLAPPTPVGMPLTEAAVDLTTLDTKHFKSQLALLKAEAEHIQKRFQWKDSEAANLRQELFALKQRFHDYKIISSAHKHPFPQVAAAAAAAARAQSLCSSCGKSLRPQVNNGQSASHPVDSAQTQDFALSTAEAATSQEQEYPAHMENHVEDLMPEGLSSRRSSIGRSDLDKTVVDVEEYLQLEDGPSIPGDNAHPSLTKPPPIPGGVNEGEEEVEEETRGVATSRRGSTPVKPPFPSGKGGGGETRGGETKSRRDVKTTSALNKTQAKRKMNPK